MHCRSTPSVRPMPIRGPAELAGQAQATASGRHITGVPVPVVSSAWHQVMYIFFSLELFIILNFGGMWAVGRPEGCLWTQCFCREKDVLHFLPVPIFTGGWSALDAVRIRAKPKAFPRLCCETREGLCLVMCCAAAQTPQCAGDTTLWLG